MEIILKKEDLEKGLKKVDTLKTHKDNTHKGLYLIVERNQYKLIRSNNSTTIVYEGVTSSKKDNKGIVYIDNYENIIKAIKHMKDGQLKVSIKKEDKEGEELQSFSRRVAITDGKRAMEVLGEIKDSHDLIPEFEILEHYEYDSDILLGRLSSVDYAINDKEDNKKLKTIFFDKDNIIGIDGHRLALSKNAGLSIKNSFGLLIEDIQTLKKALKNSRYINIGIGNDSVIIGTQDKKTSLYFNKVEKKYLDYRDIIREDSIRKITLNKKELQKELKYLASNSKSRGQGKKDPTNNSIKIQFDKKEELSIFYKVEESLLSTSVKTLESNSKEDDYRIGVNIHYLLELVGKCENEIITLELEGSFNPIIVRDTIGDIENIHLLLPVRIEDW